MGKISAIKNKKFLRETEITDSPTKFEILLCEEAENMLNDTTKHNGYFILK